MLLKDALKQKLYDLSEGIVILQSRADSIHDPRSVACDVLGRLAELPFSNDSVRLLPRNDAMILIRFIVKSFMICGPNDEQIIMDLENLFLPADAIVFSTCELAGHNEQNTAFLGRPLLDYSIEAGLISVRPDGFSLLWIGDED